MIAAQLTGGAALVRRMTDRAAKAAGARADDMLHRRRGDEARWRDAALLWPLFGDER
ncbi:hypothetical protein [Erythrobacter sp. 3-20A1M]|uniref:hypothetical protein n=1 Tax=Erythrobacter sp. 3-20A1M TaxID=2653850 RepID=UPI001BFC7BF0|nr:hypothetical protein [Erythrobacter sp. 3-20A1M]